MERLFWKSHRCSSFLGHPAFHHPGITHACLLFPQLTARTFTHWSRAEHPTNQPLGPCGKIIQIGLKDMEALYRPWIPSSLWYSGLKCLGDLSKGSQRSGQTGPKSHSSAHCPAAGWASPSLAHLPPSPWCLWTTRTLLTHTHERKNKKENTQSVLIATVLHMERALSGRNWWPIDSFFPPQ